MGRSWYGGWNTKPKLDEARILAPEVPKKHRARKDRRRWCKGKVGIEHVPELHLSKWIQSRLDRGDLDHGNKYHRELLSCCWTERKHWEYYALGKRHWVSRGDYSWHCRHEFWCVNCGKILSSAGRDCPEFCPHELDWKRNR